MTTSTTIWRIPRAAWIMVGLAVSAEATSNALRAYDLGSHLERLTITVTGIPLSLAGIVLVLAAIAVSLSQTRAAWVALTPGDTRQRIVAGIAAALLLSISITAMASHILSAQRAKVGDETRDRNGYHDTKKLYDDATAELAKVSDAVTIAKAQAAIDAAKATVDDNIWRRTKGCTDVTTRASKDECRKFSAQKAGLDAVLADATRKAELEAAIPGLKADLDRQHLTSEATASEATVSWGWAWIMGIGVVMIATFGPAIFAKVETVRDADRPEAGSADGDTSGQSDYPVVAEPSFAELRAALTGELPDRPGAEIVRFPVPNGSPNGSGPQGPKPGRRQRFAKEEALSDLKGRLDRGERFGSQDELKARYGVAKSTMSDWLREWERDGSIPPRTTNGRCKAVASA